MPDTAPHDPAPRDEFADLDELVAFVEWWESQHNPKPVADQRIEHLITWAAAYRILCGPLLTHVRRLAARIGELEGEVDHWKVKAGAYGSMARDANLTLGCGQDERLRDAAKRVAAERDTARAELAEVRRQLSVACSRDSDRLVKAEAALSEAGRQRDMPEIKAAAVRVGTLPANFTDSGRCVIVPAGRWKDAKIVACAYLGIPPESPSGGESPDTKGW